MSQEAKSLPPTISENIEAVQAYYAREERRAGTAQRVLERFSNAIGRPSFLALVLLLVLAWIVYNLLAPQFGLKAFDSPPFPALQGIVSLSALVITTVVLIGQNRLTQLEHQREQLELQVNILTEQKTTKLVHLLEELRRDLPMVRDRHDAVSAKLQQPTDTTEILTALEDAQKARDKARDDE
jgi:uncharacterized membrane protein